METPKEEAQRELALLMELNECAGYSKLLKPRIEKMIQDEEQAILDDDRLSPEDREKKRHYLKGIKAVYQLPDVIERQSTKAITEE